MTHHDDELLCMLLDGEPVDDAAQAHVAGCDECTDRLDELRRAAALVAIPVTPSSEDARAGSIAAALDAFAEREASSGVPIVRPLRRRSRWAHWGGPLLAAAAAVVALVVAVPALVDSGDGDDAGVALTEADEGARPFDAGDLGELADGDEWVEEVRAAIHGSPGAGSGTDAGEAPGAAEDADGAGGADSGPPEPAAGEDSTAMALESGSDAVELAARCAPAVRPSADDGALRYAARATWEGTPAVVLGFAAIDGDDRRVWVYVLAAEDCRILNWRRA